MAIIKKVGNPRGKEYPMAAKGSLPFNFAIVAEVIDNIALINNNYIQLPVVIQVNNTCPAVVLHDRVPGPHQLSGMSIHRNNGRVRGSVAVGHQ